MYFKRMLNINILSFCLSFLNADLNALKVRIFHSLFSVRSYEGLLGRTKNTEEFLETKQAKKKKRTVLH